jgi:hypothetical protein
MTQTIYGHMNKIKIKKKKEKKRSSLKSGPPRRTRKRRRSPRVLGPGHHDRQSQEEVAGERAP